MGVAIPLASLALGGYGAYQSSEANAKIEGRADAASRQAAADLAARKASFAKTMEEMRGNIEGFTPSGYSPEELKALQDSVAFDTGSKGRDLSTSLIQSVLGRNINPNSGAVTGAAGDLAGKLQEYSRGKLFDIQAASLNQKKAEETAKRNAMTSYLSAYDKGQGDLTSDDLASIQTDLGNANAVQAGKSKSFSDLSGALLGSLKDIDTKNPFGLKVPINSSIDYIKGLFNKKKPVQMTELDENGNPVKTAGDTTSNYYAG